MAGRMFGLVLVVVAILIMVGLSNSIEARELSLAALSGVLLTLGFASVAFSGGR